MFKLWIYRYYKCDCSYFLLNIFESLILQGTGLKEARFQTGLKNCNLLIKQMFYLIILWLFTVVLPLFSLTLIFESQEFILFLRRALCVVKNITLVFRLTLCRPYPFESCSSSPSRDRAVGPQLVTQGSNFTKRSVFKSHNLYSYCTENKLHLLSTRYTSFLAALSKEMSGVNNRWLLHFSEHLNKSWGPACTLKEPPICGTLWSYQHSCFPTKTKHHLSQKKYVPG